MRRWRQNCNRRRPRLNQEVRLRATFLRRAGDSFFGGRFVFHRVPHAGGDSPVEREAQDHDEPIEPIRAILPGRRAL